MGLLLVILSLLGRYALLEEASDILPQAMMTGTLAAGLILLIFAIGCNSARR
jgi:hypothetical protein